MAAVKTPRWIRFTRRREFVRRQIRRSRFEVVDETYTNDGFGTMSYRFRLVAGIIVELPEIGWLKLWRDHPELPLSEAEYLRYDRLSRLLAPLLSPSNRPAAQRPELACPNHGLDANGYPIPLPGTDAILAMAPPPDPPKVYENPKTLRHMKNRLRKLGYEIRSVELAGGGRWRIELVAGQTIYFREGGEISLGWGPRDYRLERLFKIEPPQERVARPFPVRRVR